MEWTHPTRMILEAKEEWVQRKLASANRDEKAVDLQGARGLETSRTLDDPPLVGKEAYIAVWMRMPLVAVPDCPGSWEGTVEVDRGPWEGSTMFLLA